MKKGACLTADACDLACKPGSVMTAIYLGPALPPGSSHLLGDSRASLVPIPVLLRIEFTGLHAFTRQPVSSYLAFPPLPPGPPNALSGELLRLIWLT